MVPLANEAVAWRDAVIRVHGHSIGVRDFGGLGPAAVLIHGLSQNRCAWNQMSELLRPELRVIAVDLRGHGASSNGSITWDSLAQDVAEASAALALNDPILIGHSFGAHVAQYTAAFHRTPPAVICIDNAAGDRSRAQEKRVGWDWTEIERRLIADPSRRPIESEELDQRVAQLRTDHPGTYGEALGMVLRCSMRSQEEDGLLVRRPSTEDILRFLRSIATRPAAATIYARTRCPTLLLFGSRSRWEKSELGRAESIESRRVRLERLAARYPNVSLEWVPAGHNLHIQLPAEVATVILKFLRAAGLMNAGMNGRLG